MTGTELVREAYEPLIAFASGIDEATGWTPTQLPGWTVRDLIYHLAMDAQRALVALARPSDQECDTDEVSYWRGWRPGTDDAQAGLRGIRICASAWSSVRGIVELYVETATAVLSVAGRADPTDSITTQGHVMTVDALLRTLAVEAAVHHLDLEPALATPPAATALAEVRRVLDGLLGQPAPTEWDDVRYARLGTGRRPLEPADHAALGPLAERFPLFG